MAGKVRGRLVPLAAMLFACSGDSSGPDDVGSGEFSVTVSGGLSATLSGNAWWVRGSQGAEGFAIDLATSSGRGVVLTWNTQTAPPVGTTPIVSVDDASTGQFILTGIFGGSGSNFGYLCESSGTGSLSITTSGSHVIGTFTSEVGCFSSSSGALVNGTVEGSFDAVEAPQQ